MYYERRKLEVPEWLSGVSGLHKRELDQREKRSRARPVAPGDALRLRQQVQTLGSYIPDDDIDMLAGPYTPEPEHDEV